MSRFEKYRSDSDQPALVKLEPGQTGTFKVTGDHEYVAKDNEGNEKIIPVLDLEERDGTPRAWMTGSWHGLEELALADPQRGDVITITRLPNRGMSYQWSVRVIQSAPKKPEPAKPEPGSQFGDDIPWDDPSADA